jgi:hypothetical protein
LAIVGAEDGRSMALHMHGKGIDWDVTAEQKVAHSPGDGGMWLGGSGRGLSGVDCEIAPDLSHGSCDRLLETTSRNLGRYQCAFFQPDWIYATWQLWPLIIGQPITLRAHVTTMQA